MVWCGGCVACLGVRNGAAARNPQPKSWCANQPEALGCRRTECGLAVGAGFIGSGRLRPAAPAFHPAKRRMDPAPLSPVPRQNSHAVIPSTTGHGWSRYGHGVRDVMVQAASEVLHREAASAFQLWTIMRDSRQTGGSRSPDVSQAGRWRSNGVLEYSRTATDSATATVRWDKATALHAALCRAAVFPKQAMQPGTRTLQPVAAVRRGLAASNSSGQAARPAVQGNGNVFAKPMNPTTVSTCARVDPKRESAAACGDRMPGWSRMGVWCWSPRAIFESGPPSCIQCYPTWNLRCLSGQFTRPDWRMPTHETRRMIEPAGVEQTTYLTDQPARKQQGPGNR